MMTPSSMLQKPHTLTGTALHLHRPAQPRAGRQPTLPVVARQAHSKDEPSQPAQKPVVLAATAALAACLVMGSSLISPADAEAARSSGRVGGSSGFRSAAPRAAAPRAAPGPSSRGPTYNNYNMSAPPLGGGGYGYGGYGGGGISVFPSFAPVYGFGGVSSGFFNLIAGLFVFTAVSSLVRSIFRKRNDEDLD